MLWIISFVSCTLKTWTPCIIANNDDPMVPHESVNGLANELTAVNADWQIHA